jgi:chemotaxis protein MotA
MNTVRIREDRQFEPGLLIGGGMAVLLVGGGILLSGRALAFLDLMSVLVVIGGTCGATLMHCTLEDIRDAIGAFHEVVFARVPRTAERLDTLIHLSQQVKSEGVLVLDEHAQRCRDPFLRLSLELAVDGQPAPEIRRILEHEIRQSGDRAFRAIHVFETMGNYSPALGLIGTLIGLIQLLGNLSDPSKVGPAMSLALIGTLYGSVMSNLFCLPIAGKLKTRVQEEEVIKLMTVEGAASLAKAESPILLEQRLQSFMAAIRRENGL